MTLVITDALDPGPAQVADGVGPGSGPGTAATGSTGGLKPLKRKFITLTYSGTYATGGNAIAVNRMGGLNALFVYAPPTGGVFYQPTYETDGSVTLKQFVKGSDDAVLAELPNATAMSRVVRLMVIGREA